MKFSIIIPTFNSQKYLKPCLDNMFEIDYPREDYEVIVVDGGSKDRTLEILKEYDVKLVHSRNISISNSRNLAASKAKGNVLVFIDSDCIPSRELLKKSEEHLKKYACCGSYYKPARNAGWIARTWLLIEGKARGVVDWIPGGTLIVRKDVFDTLGGFDEHMATGEDFDFCHRLREGGHKIFNDTDIGSRHIGQTDNVVDFVRKEMWRGNSLLKSIRQHGLVAEEMPSTLLTFYHFIAPILFVISVIVGNVYIMAGLLALLILPSTLLGLRKTFQTERLFYFFNFVLIIFIYQISRALSLIWYNQFKDLF